MYLVIVALKMRSSEREKNKANSFLKLFLFHTINQACRSVSFFAATLLKCRVHCTLYRIQKVMSSDLSGVISRLRDLWGSQKSFRS